MITLRITILSQEVISDTSCVLANENTGKVTCTFTYLIYNSTDT